MCKVADRCVGHLNELDVFLTNLAFYTSLAPRGRRSEKGCGVIYTYETMETTPILLKKGACGVNSEDFRFHRFRISLHFY